MTRVLNAACEMIWTTTHCAQRHAKTKQKNYTLTSDFFSWVLWDKISYYEYMHSYYENVYFIHCIHLSKVLVQIKLIYFKKYNIKCENTTNVQHLNQKVKLTLKWLDYSLWIIKVKVYPKNTKGLFYLFFLKQSRTFVPNDCLTVVIHYTESELASI